MAPPAVWTTAPPLYRATVALLPLLLGCLVSAVPSAASREADAAVPEALLADDECTSGGSGAGEGGACGVDLLQLRGAAPVAEADEGRSRPGLLADGARSERGGKGKRRFFWWFTDIHMDPYYGTDKQFCSASPEVAASNKFGMIRCDPPWPLMESAVEAAAQIDGGEDFVLFSGDFTRHWQDKMPDPYVNVTNTVAGVTDILNRGFRKLNVQRMVVGALGNDDSPQNYELNITTDIPKNPWLVNLGQKFFAGSVMGPERLTQWEYGGFFEAELGPITVLQIGTIIYSTRHIPSEPEPDDPFNQFAWLRMRLEQASQRGRSVWIVGHIPPGIETYGFTPLWKPKYVQAYLDIVQDPVLGNCIAAQLFGHVHADEFRILPNAPPRAGPMLLSGALSPVFRNYPCFRKVEYDEETGRLLGIKVYWAKLHEGSSEPLKWEFGYDMTSVYEPLQEASAGPDGLTNAAFRALRVQLNESWARGGPEYRDYAEWYKTRYTNDLVKLILSSNDTKNDEARKQHMVESYWCATTVCTGDAYRECSEPHTAFKVSLPQEAENQTDIAYYHAARLAHWSKFIGEDALLEKAEGPHAE